MKSPEHVTLADAEAVNIELKAATSIHKRGKYSLNIPSRIRTETGKYALCYGTEAARKRFSSKYLQYEFKRSTLEETNFERPNKANDEVMLKTKEVIIGICIAGVVISRKMVIPIGTGALKANNPNSLSESEGNM